MAGSSLPHKTAMATAIPSVIHSQCVVIGDQTGAYSSLTRRPSTVAAPAKVVRVRLVSFSSS